MSEPTPTRPPQVTLAGWLVMGGSVLVVLLAFSEVASLHSLDTREAVERRVADRGGDFFGLDVEGVLTAMRVLLMVAAASATATAILGWHVLRRSKGARIALTVLAGPLFVAGLVQQGGFASAMVTAAILMLWFQPARDWFDGITREAPASPRPLPDRPFDGTEPASGRDALLDHPPPTAPPLHPTPYAAGPAPHSARVGRRPGAVRWACVVTWSFSTCAALLFAATIVSMVADSQPLIDELQRQDPDLAARGMSDGELEAVLYAVSAGMLVWAAAAIVLAVLVWRRVRWAAIALRISAGAAAALSVIGVVSSLAFAVPVAACAAVLALLLRPEARAWLSDRSSRA
jgi:hypothetical protein